MSEFDKIPPHDIDAEKAFLCCLLTDDEALVKTGIVVNAEYFYNKANRIAFKAINELLSSGANIDLVSLKNQLVKINKLSEIGGLPYLSELMNTISTSANVKHYAEIIIEKFKLRSVIFNSTVAIESAYLLKDADSIIGDLNSAILDNHAEKSSEPVSLADYLPTYEQEQKSKHEAKNPGVSTGFECLDDAIGGFTKGTLSIIAARPGMGKSQLALQFSSNSARSKIPSGVLSLEMGKTELTNRIISARTGILFEHLRNPYKQTNDDRSKLTHYSDSIKDIGKYLIFDYCPSVNIKGLLMKIRLLKFKHNIETVFIDYLGLVNLDMLKGELKVDAIGRLTRELKVLAGELGIAIVLLAQLNREVEKRIDKRPMMSDLRDSGNIEQDADLIMFIYREYYYTKKEYSEDGRFIVNLAEIIIAKQRNGAARTVEMRFKGETVTFYEEKSKSVQELF